MSLLQRDGVAEVEVEKKRINQQDGHLGHRHVQLLLIGHHSFFNTSPKHCLMVHMQLAFDNCKQPLMQQTQHKVQAPVIPGLQICVSP